MESNRQENDLPSENEQSPDSRLTVAPPGQNVIKSVPVKKKGTTKRKPKRKREVQSFADDDI